VTAPHKSPLIRLLGAAILGTGIVVLLVPREPLRAPEPSRPAEFESQPVISQPQAPAAATYEAQDAAVKDETSLPAPPPPRKVFKTTPADLLIRYSTNEVAADLAIGDSIVEVKGLVGSIDKNFLGNPEIAMPSGVEYHAARLTFPKEATQQLATLHIGDQVVVRCDKMQRIMDSPMGDDCTLVSVSRLEAQPPAAEKPGE
jgi:hypothetical protein